MTRRSRRSEECNLDHIADRATANKVPLVTIIFWIIKILATTEW